MQPALDSSATASAFEGAFETHRRALWGLAYRMLGSAADADDLVQEAFVKALERPPPNLADPLRPWLMKVTLNLATDALRRRRRRAYIGPWLPSPIETDAERAPPSFELEDEGRSTSGRYDLLESVSFAFLVALEALTPQKRAVLLLRDVFDYSVEETATALDLSASNVKTTLHRARRALQDYDATRQPVTAELCAQHRNALEAFFTHLAQSDVKALEQLFARDARALSDSGGEFLSARKPIVGAPEIILFFNNLAQRRGMPAGVAWRMLNGLPALLTTWASRQPREPYRAVLRCELSPDGRIAKLQTILATRKLAAVDFSG